jgi:NADPH2:quinone reductase
VFFGNATGNDPGELPSLRQLIGGNASVGGFSISRLAAAAPTRVADALRRVLDLLADGTVDLPGHRGRLTPRGTRRPPTARRGPRPG